MKLKELLERWTTKTALFEPARTIMVSGPIDAKLVSELTRSDHRRHRQPGRFGGAHANALRSAQRLAR